MEVRHFSLRLKPLRTARFAKGAALAAAIVSGLARSGVPTVVRPRRVVTRAQLDCLRLLRSTNLLDHGQSEIDTCGDAAAGDTISILDNTLATGVAPNLLRMFAVGPVGTRPVAHDEPGRSYDQRTAATLVTYFAIEPWRFSQSITPGSCITAVCPPPPGVQIMSI